MLHYWELREYFGVVHLDHALNEFVSNGKSCYAIGRATRVYLVDLSPPCLNTGYVIEHRAMLPEWAALDVVNEANCGEIQVVFPFSFHHICFSDTTWCRGVG